MNLPKLEIEFKNKWVKALRSGDYIQANGALYAGESLGKPECCCLGVAEHLCGTPLENMKDLAMPNELMTEEEEGYTDYKYTYRVPNIISGNGGKIDKEDKEELKQLISFNGITLNFTVASVLAIMNDKGMSFEEIADFIEKYL